jgi:hypothetical protein
VGGRYDMELIRIHDGWQFATVKINPARRFHIATTAERKD